MHYPHDFIKTGDADVFRAICDRNGEVVLAYCRRCRRGECDLAQLCPVLLAERMLIEAVEANATELPFQVSEALQWLHFVRSGD